jgi:serpin B
MKRIVERGTVLFAALLVLSMPVTTGCGAEEPGEVAGRGTAASPGATADEIGALITGNTEFALELYSRIGGDGNLFFSPYSITAALSMTAAGARSNTELEMARVLRFPTEGSGEAERPVDRDRIAASFASLEAGLRADPSEAGYELHVANSLWGQEDYPFVGSYLELLKANYGAGVSLVDFVRNAEGARLRINEWVETETREKIVDLIPPGGVNSATTLVLANAVYFKGDWARKFKEDRTEDAVFHGESGDSDVPMMYQKGEFGYAEVEGAQLLEMPYKGDDVSMLVVLPDGERVTDLSLLEAGLTPALLSEWTGAMTERDVKVYFPRFEMTWGTADISSHLVAMGMREAFAPGADFSGMTERNDLYIGPVFHKAFVAVNEEGTEAAAATAVVMKRAAVEIEPVFRADRPFMFLIRENRTGSILFMGRVANL